MHSIWKTHTYVCSYVLSNMCKQSLFGYTSLFKKMLIEACALKEKEKKCYDRARRERQNFRTWDCKVFTHKKYGETLCRKEPCNVHVNLTGIAGKPQICAKIEGKYEFNFCRKKHVNISKYTYEINGKCIYWPSLQIL